MASVTDPAGVDPHDRTGGSKILKHRLYTGPASYTTLGDPVSASDFGLGVLEEIWFSGVAYDGISAVRLVAYNPTTGKVLWFIPNTGAEVAAAVNLSTFTVLATGVGH